MASKMIGIEIGTSTLKLAVVRGGKVIHMAAARMPDGLVREGRVTSPETMTSFIRNLMRENGIRGGQCAMVLPRQIVVAQHVTMPIMSESELKLNLPFEFRDYIGKDTEDYDFDYIVLGIRDSVMELYAAAARRSIVEAYWNILKRAGLALKVAMPAEMAWLNILTAAQGAPGKLCIVDIGHSTTRINIFANGNFVMGKDIEYAGQLFDETIAAETHVDPHVARTQKEANINKVQSAEYMQQPYGALIMEIMKAINFYHYSIPTEEAVLNDLYYCGGSSAIAPLRTAIVNATGLTLHHIHRLIAMDGITCDMALTCGLAAGAALQNQ